MTDSAYSYTATAGNFEQLVLENSRKGPVMVNYWAAWAGPCMMLMPVLERLAADYGGRFLLVHVDTAAEQALTREQGIRSLPTLKIFRNGEAVRVIHGGQPEAELRKLLDRHLNQPVHPLHAAGIQAYRRGDPEQALLMLARAAQQDPESLHLAMDRAKLLLKHGGPDAAKEVLMALPEASREEPRAADLLAHLEFLLAARDAPDAAALRHELSLDPEELEPRWRLAALALMEDDYESALELLVEILQRDRDYRDEMARKGLLALFRLLGPEHPLVAHWRARLADALY
jgi:putative thioredoxin